MEPLENEKELIRKIQKGDLESFEILVRFYEKYVYNVTFRILQDKDLAMDVTQDTFLNVFKNINGFRGDSKFVVWLYRIAINSARLFLKTNKRKEIFTFSQFTNKNMEDGGGFFEPVSLKDEYEAIFDEKDLVNKKIFEALKKLPVEFKNPIVLVDIEKLSYDEAQKILNISPGTLKSRLFRGREKLRAILEKEGTFPL